MAEAAEYVETVGCLSAGDVAALQPHRLNRARHVLLTHTDPVKPTNSIRRSVRNALAAAQSVQAQSVAFAPLHQRGFSMGHANHTDVTCYSYVVMCALASPQCPHTTAHTAALETAPGEP